jgi:hypothetical protein
LVDSTADRYFGEAHPKKLHSKAYQRCGHQPVITTVEYSSQADQFQIGGCLRPAAYITA